jgi:hypothetical protein
MADVMILMRPRRRQLKPENVMRSLLIAFVIGVSAATMAMPVTAQAHWHHVHGVWHHVWHRGPSYYPIYGFNDYGLYSYGHVCVWHREWDGYWDRDCI